VQHRENAFRLLWLCLPVCRHTGVEEERPASPKVIGVQKGTERLSSPTPLMAGRLIGCGLLSAARKMKVSQDDSPHWTLLTMQAFKKSPIWQLSERGRV